MNIIIRPLGLSDYNDLKTSMVEAYHGTAGGIWPKSSIKHLLSIFPEGQLCVEVDDHVVACALSIIVDSKKTDRTHSYEEITGKYTFNTHDPEGDVLYGIELFVHPDYRDLRLGRRLYDARKELCEQLNLKSIIAGGRIPKYHEHADTLTPKQYIEKVKQKELYDPTLTFQLSNDFHVKKILKNYLPEDRESLEYATLLEWNNIYYEPKTSSISPTKQTIRLGLIQWQMRLFNNVEAFYDQIEFFVDVVSGYGADFALFPEFFNTPLMEPYNHLPEREAMRMLAKHTEEIKEKIQRLAVSYNVNIIAGSMPSLSANDRLYNTTYLCHRSGKVDAYNKVHITPNELKYYGMYGGDKVQVFDTDCGKIGIQICYDVEFPELSRIMADQGMKILFVPFLTDTQNGYTRVRNCAQARAIENECYVAIAGSVGNLPKVNNMDIQYAQSAVFTPSDFAFPTNGVKAEATPNAEMVLLTDVDLYALKELHEYGTVKTMKDRRTDLYKVNLLK
ncbi:MULTISPECIES: carbon-nitrogen hydrolase family protein [Olivibacter]|jgi:predicted amidohydrolase/GNAT superfamily N-acetyltransferase|uniref:Nitrilase/cyanide hydratase and apolipoprotein N-acyltransferase n=3 Tax=Sphingobacteriaceae TaxID=84566 RepID=F4CEC2_SPHS2|nr:MULTISPECIES: bifunctional GNAT family N-acetyltransferase/carbon-nitrogen hydrolase family protein [unclassified Olivibacter]MCL4640776.1 bifunctional GNAT family N-acetyltransferase/carbon-nitrogen hydrolase family protein [Olivibacter sp. UJ_SKK_5.1]MDM8176247.1 bifunctional GNAT family N-acetyltransferase/carbon-nitrogen hydrolase family protein [Olivibacter sp. 47]MDX3915782.1 bifunctional GNAT family N-acetyltransferase/carbon-nitrogen hydrolase family protein [Pseudosphingobacterium sp